MTVDPVLLLIGALLVATLAAHTGTAYLWNRWRDARMRRAAQTMGFRVEPPNAASAFLDLAGPLPILRKGRNWAVRRLLRGQLGGRDTAIFEFRYTTYHHRYKIPGITAQTIVLFLDAARMPGFALEPETLLGRLVDRVMLHQDINFPEHDAFSKRYCLVGRGDTAAIRRTFTGEALTLLADMPGWSVQSDGGRLAVFRAGRLTAPQHVPKLAEDALRIVRALRRSDA